VFRRGGRWLAVIAVAVLLAGQSISAAWARPAADSAILFIGDGMGPVQIQLGEAAAGQPLAIQKMPYSGLVTTLAADGEITDSAAASTALSTGRKTNGGVLGLTPDGRRLETILERCRKAGKSTGIISNDALTGATPAGFAVHVDDRGKRAEIALQMARSGADVMMGYDKEEFLPTSAGGNRKDGLDLIAEMRKKGYEVVFNRDELAKAKGRRLVGLWDGSPPTLDEMVKAALPRLAQNRRGFFLVVEQARVDWDEGDPAAVALEVVELDQAVQAALDYADKRGRTLVAVTADHETGDLRVAHPGRLAVLRGVKASASGMAEHLDRDRTNVGAVLEEYAALSDMTEAELAAIKQAKKPEEAIAAVISARAGVTWTLGHTATRVRVFASGPMADQFTGEMDNTDIPKRIAAALGVGPLGGAR